MTLYRRSRDLSVWQSLDSSCQRVQCQEEVSAGVEAGAASTYANVFLVGGVIVLAALVIFIVTKKMIYSRSRKDDE